MHTLTPIGNSQGILALPSTNTAHNTSASYYQVSLDFGNPLLQTHSTICTKKPSSSQVGEVPTHLVYKILGDEFQQEAPVL